jgi:K+-transporting ATPase A subunit
MAMGGKGSGTEWIMALVVVAIILAILLIVR